MRDELFLTKHCFELAEEARERGDMPVGNLKIAANYQPST